VDPQKLAHDMLPKTTPLCTAAHARPADTSTSGSVKGPAIGLVRHDEKYTPHAEWNAYGFGYSAYIPPHAHATSEDGVRIVVCAQGVGTQVGFYQPNNVPAIRLDLDVRIIRYPTGEPLASMTFQGPDPAPEINTTSQNPTSLSGSYPTGELNRWLQGLIER
jgi:hypothetical protein